MLQAGTGYLYRQMLIPGSIIVQLSFIVKANGFYRTIAFQKGRVITSRSYGNDAMQALHLHRMIAGYFGTIAQLAMRVIATGPGGAISSQEQRMKIAGIRRPNVDKSVYSYRSEGIGLVCKPNCPEEFWPQACTRVVLPQRNIVYFSPAGRIWAKALCPKASNTTITKRLFLIFIN